MNPRTLFNPYFKVRFGQDLQQYMQSLKRMAAQAALMPSFQVMGCFSHGNWFRHQTFSILRMGVGLGASPCPRVTLKERDWRVAISILACPCC